MLPVQRVVNGIVCTDASGFLPAACYISEILVCNAKVTKLCYINKIVLFP